MRQKTPSGDSDRDRDRGRHPARCTRPVGIATVDYCSGTVSRPYAHDSVVRSHFRLLLPMLAAAVVSFALGWVAWADCGPHGSYHAGTDACAACHQSHTSPNAVLLVGSSSPPICFKCHSAPHNQGQDCLQCHDPHRCGVRSGNLRLNTARGAVGSDEIAVTFSEGASGDVTGTTSLLASAFIVADTNPQLAVVDVSHAAGSDRDAIRAL